MDLQTLQLGGRIDCKATGRGNWYTLNDGDGFFDLLPIYFCRKKGSQSNLETPGLEPNARKLIVITRK